MKRITCGDIYFNIRKIGDTNRIDFECFHADGSGQGILTLDSQKPHQLYIWYDEGRFPKCIDTKSDNDTHHKRLRITGVDEL